MSWKRRLIEIALAGGMAGAAGCGPLFHSCNANPDPCCSEPDSQACYEYDHPIDLSYRPSTDMSLVDQKPGHD